jgi:hypothetical protein
MLAENSNHGKKTGLDKSTRICQSSLPDNADMIMHFLDVRPTSVFQEKPIFHRE